MPLTEPPGPLVIEGVTVLPMTGHSPPLLNRTVVVENRRVSQIASADLTRIPPRATRVDGRGRWLMPGLTDMHVHIENPRLLREVLNQWQPGQPVAPFDLDEQGIFWPYIRHGVLQVLNLSAMAETTAQREAIQSGRLIGPHLALAAMLDGPDPFWPAAMSRAVNSEAAARRAVREAQAAGHDFIKVYGGLRLPTFTAIVQEARRRNMRVVGHLPGRGQGNTAAYLQPGFDLIAHAEELYYQNPDARPADIRRYAELARQNGSWLVATLVTNERLLAQLRDPALPTRVEGFDQLPPVVQTLWTRANPYLAASTPTFTAQMERVVEFNRQLVRAFVEAGVPVLAGTDALLPGVAAGESLHEELRLLTKAGMSNEQVLVAATRQSAEWLGTSGERGTVEVGKRADLLLLRADPLVDIRNTRQIEAVILDGRYLNAGELSAQQLW